MRINALRWVLVVLAPLAAAWNGQGSAEIMWAPERSAEGVSLRATAVGVVHEDVIEAVVVLPVPGLTGDGVLTVRASQSMRNGDAVALPNLSVRVRLREYADDGTALFRGLVVESGSLRVEGPSTGPVRFVLEAVLKDGLQSRKITGHFELGPIEAVRDEYVDEETGEAEVIYHAANSGCWGTWDETDDDPNEVDWEDDETESGCGGDDLDDDGPSGSGGCDDEDPGGSPDEVEGTDSSESGCEGDGTDDYESDTSDDTGCEGDNVDSDSSDSGCDCGDDSVDTAGAACARSGPGGPRGSRFAAQLVAWLPWFLLFAFIHAMRIHARRPRLRTAA